MQQQLLQVEAPYNFELIPKLFLRSKERNTPYKYLPTEWSCLIPVENKQIPILIEPHNIDNNNFLDVKIFGRVSTADSNKVLKIINRSFNSKLALDKFYKIVEGDKNFYNVVHDLIGLKPFFSINPYHSLIRTVIRQLISAQGALGIMSSLVVDLGEKYQIGSRTIYGMPSPEKLSRVNKQKLLKCRVGYKWKLIKSLAKDIVTGDLNFDELRKKKDDYIVERLTEYPGIGEWTARTFIFDGLCRTDSYPIYDISVVKAISNLYYNSKRIGNREVDEFFERYEEFRGLAITYLFGSIWLTNQRRIGN